MTRKRTVRNHVKPADHREALTGPDQENEGAGSAVSEDSGAHPNGERELENIEDALALDAEPVDDAGADKGPDGWEAIHVAGLLQMAFGSIAMARGAHWELADREAEKTGGALEAVLDKYFPDGPGRFGAEIGLFSCVVMVLAPRLKTDADIARRFAAEQAAAAEAEQAGHTPEKTPLD